MIAGDEMQSVGQKVFEPVGEAVGGFPRDNACVKQIGKIAIKSNFAKADYNADARESLYLFGEVFRTVSDLLRERLVARRGATDDGGYPCMAEFESVVAGDGFGFAGEAEVVEDGVHEVARAIAGEWPSRTVGTMSAGGKSKYEDASARITEAGYGTGPVGLVLVGTATGLTKAAAVVSQAGATLAGDDGIANLLELGCRLDYRTIHASNDLGA
jgi:hypothetical protein